MRSSKKSTNELPWLRIGVLGLLVVIVAVGVVIWGEPLWGLVADRARFQELVANLGPWGPFATIALNAAQVVLAPVPGYAIGLANGYLFGLWLGTLYSMLGLLIGSAVAMALGRVFGRPLVEGLVSDEILSRWDGITSRRGPMFFFLVFLVPGLPDDIVSFVIGLSSLPIHSMLVLGLLGRLPGVFVSSWIGANAASMPLWAWVPLVAGVGGLAWLFLRYGDNVEMQLIRALSRLAPQRTAGEENRAPEPGRDHPRSGGSGHLDRP